MKSFYMIGDMGTGGVANIVTSPDLVPGMIAITRIFVPDNLRGKGAARTMLQEVLDDADREQVVLCLEVVPDGGLDYEQLEAWYKRHGFKWHKWGIMVRKPQP